MSATPLLTHSQTDPKPPLSRGDYAPARPTDLRSPCPMVNCLANHGYIPRDGRSVRADELYAAVKQTGVSAGVAAAFSYPIYGEHRARPPGKGHRHEAQPAGWRGWWLTRRLRQAAAASPNPFARLGMRRPGQTDAVGRRVLDLDQLALPGVIEHDVSLTRRDHQQPEGNNARQADLVEELLASSTDGKTITRENLAALRRRRISEQQEENPGLLYGDFEHLLSCGEISLILGVIGNGTSVPVEYARAFLLEERLPFAEGWTSRRWWALGVIELQIAIFKVWRMIDIKVR